MVENRKICLFFMLSWAILRLLLSCDAVYCYVLKWNMYLPFLLVFSFKNILRGWRSGKVVCWASVRNSVLSTHLKVYKAMCSPSPGQWLTSGLAYQMVQVKHWTPGPMRYLSQKLRQRNNWGSHLIVTSGFCIHTPS